MVLSEAGEVGETSTEEVVGAGYGTGRVGEVRPAESEGKLSEPDDDDGFAEGYCDGGRGAVSVTVYVLWPG